MITGKRGCQKASTGDHDRGAPESMRVDTGQAPEEDRGEPGTVGEPSADPRTTNQLTAQASARVEARG